MMELASKSVAVLQPPYLRYLGHHGPLADAMSLGAGDVYLYHPSLLPDSLPPPELQELPGQEHLVVWVGVQQAHQVRQALLGELLPRPASGDYFRDLRLTNLLKTFLHSGHLELLSLVCKSI